MLPIREFTLSNGQVIEVEVTENIRGMPGQVLVQVYAVDSDGEEVELHAVVLPLPVEA